MYLVNENEYVIYNWQSDKEESDSIAVTDKRLYHHNKQKNIHTCVSVKDVKMVKFSTKLVRREGEWWQTFLKILTLISVLAIISTLISKEISSIIGDNDTLIFFSIFIALLLIQAYTRNIREAVMEIEYGSGNKVDISMKIFNETVMFQIRDAIFTAIDVNDSHL